MGNSNKSEEFRSLIECFLIWCKLNQINDYCQKDLDRILNNKDKLPLKTIYKEVLNCLKCKASYGSMKKESINDSILPLVFYSSSTNEWMILSSKSKDEYLIKSTRSTTPQVIKEEAFNDIWSNTYLKIKVKNNLLKSFDIKWFIPELFEHKCIAIEILAASVIIEFLALITPLFFQVIFDKVIVHNALSTLDVLIFVLIFVSFLEITQKTLRQYLANHTATKIDTKLGSKLYKHLLELPLIYFKSRSIGITVTRVNELNSIREFITGSANTLIIDLSFSIIFFMVMYYYSPFLTLIVALSIPCYITFSWLITAPLQKQIEILYRDAAINTSFLTETLIGIETVKSLSLEPRIIRKWEYQTKDFVYSNYKVQNMMALSSMIVQIIQKVTMVLVLWIGSKLVINLEISIGQLIAFNMMANHVSQPIIRLTELWRDFVQAKVSLDRLGDVLNHTREVNQDQNKNIKDIKGDIAFNQVTFRYEPQLSPIINNFNIKIPNGKMIAFVGPSGSGKSTIARLIQKLYIPEQGSITLDSVNITEINPESLRKHIGIVLQDNFLFNKTVRENISIHNPSASLEEVVAASKMSGSHDFILKLKDGYDTVISEGGQSLSGGQRQRIAIARCLISDPKVIIFDEATSALDDESQRLIHENMESIRHQRTIIYIAHRLSTVVDCDQIYVLNNGQIVETGSHQDLLKINSGMYQRLWRLQSSSLSLKEK